VTRVELEGGVHCDPDQVAARRPRLRHAAEHPRVGFRR
jgi:hypothetical protein